MSDIDQGTPPNADELIIALGANLTDRNVLSMSIEHGCADAYQLKSFAKTLFDRGIYSVKELLPVPAWRTRQLTFEHIAMPTQIYDLEFVCSVCVIFSMQGKDFFVEVRVDFSTGATQKAISVFDLSV